MAVALQNTKQNATSWAVGVTQNVVLPAAAGVHAAEFGEGQRTEQRHHTTGGPNPQREVPVAGDLRHISGCEEDADADDSANDDVGGANAPEHAAQAGVGGWIG